MEVTCAQRKDDHDRRGQSGLPHASRALPALAADLRRPRRHLDHGRGRAGRPAPGLRAQAELLRPRGRHRAVRRGAAAAVRAPRGPDGRGDERQGQGLLRRGQHPDAGGVAHPWKVNFCKFTNETRSGIEEATLHSGQTYLAALNGTASGGGYELALACEHIMLVDDRSSAVSLPELPLLGVLPGTGGLTRLVDKRHVRRDRADYSRRRPKDWPAARRSNGDWSTRRCSSRSGMRSSGSEPGNWARGPAAQAGADGTGIELAPLAKTRTDTEISYDHVTRPARPGAGRGRDHRVRAGRIGPAERAARQPGRAARAGRQLLDPGSSPGS